jgi:cytidylate kinase
VTAARVVAIDGPAGAGKSTVARGVADALGLPVLDTGAMYRAVTFAVLERGVDPSDLDTVVAIAGAVTIDVGPPTLVDGVDVTAAIRGPEVTATVSIVAANQGVRGVLVGRQREWIAAHGGGVVEGRDIGTVVAPDAPVKVFLIAADDERARRRQRDEAGARRAVDIDGMRESLARRDHIDSSREASPLKPADDAVVIDTTGRDPGDVIADITRHFRRTVGKGKDRAL